MSRNDFLSEQDVVQLNQIRVEVTQRNTRIKEVSKDTARLSEEKSLRIRRGTEIGSGHEIGRGKERQRRGAGLK